MKGINLHRTIKVRCWRVIGQVAKAAKRPELMAVLLRARERGDTDEGDVAEHLLFERRSRRVVAERLLRLAVAYGLLNEVHGCYGLTDHGNEALETEQVFVPEHGTWTICASDDPLLAAPIVRVAPWVEPTAYDEVLGDERDSARKRSFEKLPPWVRDAVGVVATPLVGGAPLRIDHMEEEGEAADPETTLRVAWDVSSGRLRVDGTLAGSRVNAAIDAPELGADAVWMQLLQGEGLWSNWDASARALRVAFEEATAVERESLVRAVTVRHPDIASLGAFEATTVDGVALRARSAQDATRWAEWRLRVRVRDYATAERFKAWTAEAIAPLSEFNPSTPTRQALAHAAWRTRTDPPTPSAWHFVAAEDWRL